MPKRDATIYTSILFTLASPNECSPSFSPLSIQQRSSIPFTSPLFTNDGGGGAVYNLCRVKHTSSVGMCVCAPAAAAPPPSHPKHARTLARPPARACTFRRPAAQNTFSPLAQETNDVPTNARRPKLWVSRPAGRSVGRRRFECALPTRRRHARTHVAPNYALVRRRRRRPKPKPGRAVPPPLSELEKSSRGLRCERTNERTHPLLHHLVSVCECASAGWCSQPAAPNCGARKIAIKLGVGGTRRIRALDEIAPQLPATQRRRAVKGGWTSVYI